MIDETTIPWPPRYRWTKRWAIFGSVTLVAVVGVRLWWGHVAQKRFDAMIADAQAKGRLAVVTDLQDRPVPDEQNAAFFFTRAARAISKVTETPSSSTIETPDYFPYHPKWHEMATAAVKANAAVYPDAIRAASLPDVDSGVRFTSPVLNVLFPSYNDARSLANVLADTTLYRHFNGDDFGALEMAKTGRALARAGDHTPLLIASLVAVGCDAAAVNRVQMIAGGLTIDGVGPPQPSPVKQPATRPATRKQMTDMIADLLDDAPYAVARQRAIYGEGVYLCDTIEFYSRPAFVLRPMYLLDAARGRARLGKAAERMATPWVSPKASQVRMPSDSVLQTLATFGTSIMEAAVGRVEETHRRALLDRRITAIALAMRLYQVDHSGAFPPTLDALVPTYLPAVPRDPHADDRQLGYMLRDNGKRPMAYGVGENSVDDTSTGGSPLSTRVYWGYQGANYDAVGKRLANDDQYRDLTQWMPATPPTDWNFPFGRAASTMPFGQAQSNETDEDE